MSVEAMYQEIILDHYRNPQGKGLREPFEVEVHHINPTCGDEVTLRVALADNPADAADPLVSLSYDGQGCSISQASQSVLFEQLDGVPLSEGMAAVDEFLELLQAGVHGYTPDEDVLGDAVAFSGVAKYPARVKCALLGWMAWKDAVAQALAAREPAGNPGEVILGGPPAGQGGGGGAGISTESRNESRLPIAGLVDAGAALPSRNSSSALRFGPAVATGAPAGCGPRSSGKPSRMLVAIAGLLFTPPNSRSYCACSTARTFGSPARAISRRRSRWLNEAVPSKPAPSSGERAAMRRWSSYWPIRSSRAPRRCRRVRDRQLPALPSAPALRRLHRPPAARPTLGQTASARPRTPGSAHAGCR